MIYPIYVYGTPVLRKKAKEIPRDFEGLDELIDSMFETMTYSEGVGLAAPQIGMSLRLFVIDATQVEEDDEEYFPDFKKEFINPVLLDESGNNWLFNEGCLSLPSIREDVDRPEKVRIHYFDRNWEEHEEVYDGIRARIIQHEYDHLEGILFIDKINPLRKRLLGGKLRSISKGNVDVDYKIKTLSR